MPRLALYLLCLCIGSFVLAAPSARPNSAGLVLWLDAGDAASMDLDEGGRLLRWTDKSGRGHDAAALAPPDRPRRLPSAWDGRAAIRFDGARTGLRTIGTLRAERGTLTIFVVSRRLTSSQTDPKWQRLVSARDADPRLPDNRAPNFCLMAATDGAPDPYAARVDDREFAGTLVGGLTIGRGAGNSQQGFAGDIAEILVYDRAFLSDDESRAILDYLAGKWNARIAREEHGWTRVGLLPDPPQRHTDSLPLSDQQNRSGWVRQPELSDEFDGNALDSTKWRPEYPGWKGRQPARFSPANVAVRDGSLQLTMRKEPIPPELAAPGYEGYTSAAVDSIHRAHFGYYEVRAKPMNSAGSSSFWFSRTDVPKRGTEIDVFEIGGNAPTFERKLNMNVHVWETPEEKRHWSIGSAWNAPWRLADDYHVYGFEWDSEEMKIYVDGVIVRRVKNTHWHDALHLQFDSETMPTWFGMPRDEDLPSTYYIDYIRAWRRP